MARDQQLEAAIAATRFGLGARPGELDLAGGDPRGFLKSQIRSDGADIPASGGESSAQRIANFRDYQRERRAAREQGRPQEDPVRAARRMIVVDAGGDFLARVRLGCETPAGFRERWALFFANHFTVSAIKLATSTVVGPFEAEAIRPHVFGRFADLLVAAETHPAMLLYLDQAQSIGPQSRAAMNASRRADGRKLGLNENLAREILELHTVGVDGGYGQADVTELARAMTGLSIGSARDGDMLGRPVFREAAHQPGARTVMGKSYSGGGREQVTAILGDLARRPQTARLLCAKLARHFVADAPPSGLVERLERAWVESDGALDHVAVKLIDSPEVWAPEQRKFKTPYEFLLSSWRALGATPAAIAQVAPPLNALGQKAYSPPSPEGWPDEAGAWASPAGIVQRMSWSQAFAARAGDALDPNDFARSALGSQLSTQTAAAIRRSESRAEGMALALMSPEFQRR